MHNSEKAHEPWTVGDPWTLLSQNGGACLLGSNPQHMDCVLMLAKCLRSHTTLECSDELAMLGLRLGLGTDDAHVHHMANLSWSSGLCPAGSASPFAHNSPDSPKWWSSLSKTLSESEDVVKETLFMGAFLFQIMFTANRTGPCTGVKALRTRFTKEVETAVSG